MRCYCCNNPLSGRESLRRFRESNTFTDMCDRCLNEIDVPTIEGKGNEEDEDLFDEDGNYLDESDW